MQKGGDVNMKWNLHLAILWLVVGIIGLVSYLGGVRSVNLGACLFPLALALFFFYRYKRRS